jgi:hypothetical protein
MLTKLVTMMVLGMFLNGCGSTDIVDSTDVNEDRVFRDYRVSFNENNHWMELFAQFRLGGNTGTTIRLVDPSQVKINDVRLSYKSDNEAVIHTTGGYYGQNVLAEDFVAEYTAIWTKNSGAEVRNSFSMPASMVITRPEESSEHNQSEALFVTFKGDQPSPDGRIMVSIASIENQQQEPVVKYLSVGREVVFTRNELMSLPPGKAIISLTRTTSSHIESTETDLGGRVSLITESKSVMITLKQ